MLDLTVIVLLVIEIRYASIIFHYSSCMFLLDYSIRFLDFGVVFDIQ